MTDTAFEGFIVDGGKLIGIRTSRGEFGCRWVVNAAGTYSDDIMHMAGDAPEFTIHPRKGEYYILDKTEIQLDNILFPVPTGTSKGILVLGSTHGNVLVGPNSMNETDKENSARHTGRVGGNLELCCQTGALRFLPAASLPFFQGCAQPGMAPCKNKQVDYGHDFVIEPSEHLRGVIHLAGIESPGLTAAPAIAQRVVELMIEDGEKMVEKKDWNPIREPRPSFNHLTRAEQIELWFRKTTAMGGSYAAVR